MQLKELAFIPPAFNWSYLEVNKITNGMTVHSPVAAFCPILVNLDGVKSAPSLAEILHHVLRAPHPAKLGCHGA